MRMEDFDINCYARQIYTQLAEALGHPGWQQLILYVQESLRYIFGQGMALGSDRPEQ